MQEFKRLPYKTNHELVAAFNAGKKFVATYGDLEPRPVIAVRATGCSDIVNVQIEGIASSHTCFVHGFSNNSEKDSWVVLYQLDDATADPKRDASAVEAPRAIDLVCDSDKPGIAAAKALPPEAKPTLAPTFEPPKTSFVAGLLMIHNPDKRSF